MNRPSLFTWRPTTTFFLIGGFVVILIALVVSYVLNTFQPTTMVRAGSGIYYLSIADTEAERRQGLSGVEKLNPNNGLLMKFDSDDTWGIWMKDMLIPIDIVWVNKDKQVVYVVKDAQPDLGMTVTFAPKDPARYVIELPAGSTSKAAIKRGTIVNFDENDKGSLW